MSPMVCFWYVGKPLISLLILLDKLLLRLYAGLGLLSQADNSQLTVLRLIQFQGSPPDFGRFDLASLAESSAQRCYACGLLPHLVQNRLKIRLGFRCDALRPDW